MRFSQYGAFIFSILFLGAQLSPIMEHWSKKPQDSFPFSYYPMCMDNPGVVYNTYYFVGFDHSDNRYVIPYHLAGPESFHDIHQSIIKSVEDGKASIITEVVAQRIAKEKEDSCSRITTVKLVRGAYHLENYFVDNIKLPVNETVFADLKINR